MITLIEAAGRTHASICEAMSRLSYQTKTLLLIDYKPTDLYNITYTHTWLIGLTMNYTFFNPNRYCTHYNVKPAIYSFEITKSFKIKYLHVIHFKGLELVLKSQFGVGK